MVDGEQVNATEPTKLRANQMFIDNMRHRWNVIFTLFFCFQYPYHIIEITSQQ